MKYAIIGKITPEMVDDSKSFEFFIRDMIAEETKDLYRESKRFMFAKLQVGEQGDDFLYHTLTVRVVGNVYKISRIIKNKIINEQNISSYRRDRWYRWIKRNSKTNSRV